MSLSTGVPRFSPSPTVTSHLLSSHGTPPFSPSPGSPLRASWTSFSTSSSATTRTASTSTTSPPSPAATWGPPRASGAAPATADTTGGLRSALCSCPHAYSHSSPTYFCAAGGVRYRRPSDRLRVAATATTAEEQQRRQWRALTHRPLTHTPPRRHASPPLLSATATAAQHKRPRSAVARRCAGPPSRFRCGAPPPSRRAAMKLDPITDRGEPHRGAARRGRGGPDPSDPP